MDTSMNFNTHKYIKELMNAGMDEKQAEIITFGMLESRDHDISRLATKEQLAHVEEKLSSQIKTVEQRLEAKIDAVEQRLDAKIDAVDAKIDAVEQRLDAKIDAASSQTQLAILKWVIPLMLGNTALIIGALVKLYKI